MLVACPILVPSFVLHIRFAQAHVAVVTRREIGKNANGKLNLSTGMRRRQETTSRPLYVSSKPSHYLSTGEASRADWALQETPVHSNSVAKRDAVVLGDSCQRASGAHLTERAYIQRYSYLLACGRPMFRLGTSTTSAVTPELHGVTLPISCLLAFPVHKRDICIFSLTCVEIKNCCSTVDSNSCQRVPSQARYHWAAQRGILISISRAVFMSTS